MEESESHGEEGAMQTVTRHVGVNVIKQKPRIYREAI
jgi:hypothetical protein